MFNNADQIVFSFKFPLQVTWRVCGACSQINTIACSKTQLEPYSNTNKRIEINDFFIIFQWPFRFVIMRKNPIYNNIQGVQIKVLHPKNVKLLVLEKYETFEAETSPTCSTN